MDTFVHDADVITHSLEADEPLWDVPTGILTHEPERAEPGSEHVWPEVSGNAKPDYLHPAVLAVAAAGYAWFLLAFWTVFWGYGYMMLALSVATLISVTMLGLMVAGGSGGRNVTQWERPWHSFREFLDGDVAVWGARVPGREAFVQLAAMAWLLAGLATAFAVIIALVRTT